MTIVDPSFLAEIDAIDQRLYQLEQMLTAPSVSTGNMPTDPIINTILINGTLISTAISPVTGVVLAWSAFYNDLRLDVSWTPPADGTAATYEVELLKKNADLTYQLKQVEVTGGNTLRFVALNPSTTYGVRVTAVNKIGLRSTPVPAAGYTDITIGKDSTVPAQTVGVAAYSFPKGIIVRWTDNTDPDVNLGTGSYVVQVASDSAFTTIVKQATVSGVVAPFPDLVTSQTSGTGTIPFWVRVAAIDASGNQGPWSASVNPTPSSIQSGDIAALTIVGGNIVGQTLTGDKVNANTLDAHSIKTSSLDVAIIGLNSTGSINAGNANYGVIFNSSGLRGYLGGVVQFSLDAPTGNATFTGAITSSTVTGTSSVTGAVIKTTGDKIILSDSGLYMRATTIFAGPNSLRWVDPNTLADASQIYTTVGGTLVLNAPVINLNNFSGGQFISCQGTSVFFYQNMIQSAGGTYTDALYPYHNTYIDTRSLQLNSNSNLLVNENYQSGVWSNMGVMIACTAGGYAGLSMVDHAASTGAIIYWASAGSGAAPASVVCRNSADSFWANFVCNNIYTVDGVMHQSSLRFKENVQHFGDDATSLLDRMRPIRFHLAENHRDPAEPFNHKAKFGFVAEEMAQVLPEVVAEDAEGRPSSINLSSLIPVLVKGFQELTARVQTLEGV